MAVIPNFPITRHTFGNEMPEIRTQTRNQSQYPNIASAIKVGKRQTIETLISEEALLFAKYLRNEKKDWQPRVGLTQ